MEANMEAKKLQNDDPNVPFLEKAIVHLLSKERFHAYMLMQMERIVDPKLKAAAAVTIQNRQAYLIINPTLFETKTVAEAAAILIHECMHLYNRHHRRYTEISHTAGDRKLTFRAANISMDCAINQYIQGLAEGCISLEWFNKTFGGKAEAGQTWEYYYELIKEDVQQNPSKYPDNSGHSWDGSSDDGDGDSKDGSSKGKNKGEDDGEMTDQVVRDIVKNARDKCNDVGDLPAHIKLALDALFHTPRNWKQDIRRFAARVFAAKSKPTWTRRNRRYGLQQAGFKSDARLSLAVGWDTSGSMDDETCAQIWTELKRLSKDAELYIVECDCEVGAQYKFKKHQAPGCTGRGGTSFAPAFEAVQKSGIHFDGMLYFTDGGGPGDEIIKNPPFPVLWCLTDPFMDTAIPFTDPRYRQTTKIEIKKVK